MTCDDIQQLAPTGRLRGGVVVAPAASAFFCIKDGGEVRGITVDLLAAFAAALETAARPAGVLPIPARSPTRWPKATATSPSCRSDAERAKKVDFGPAYFVIDSTYLVPAGSTIQTIDEVNRPGVRIVAIANTTTVRSARRTAPLAGRGSAERRL